MSDHTTAFVPLEAWCYSSPEVRDGGCEIDVGLLAEALIYYDSVLLNVSTQPHLAALIAWFQAQDRFGDLVTLLRDGTIRLYDYSFISAPIHHERLDTYLFANLQDPLQAQPKTFEQRFLYHPSVEAVLTKARQRRQLYEAVRDRVIEVKAAEFGLVVDNAERDHRDPRRSALVVQAFVDALYQLRKLGRPPTIIATVTELPDRSNRIQWSVNVEELAAIAGPRLAFQITAPLAASVAANRYLWSAATQSCDLYLGSPLALVVGDKLYESAERVAKAGAVIEQLKHAVEFPDVRQLVNTGVLKLPDILRIRREARRFREWLQNESDRDRDALFAYHAEVGAKLGVPATTAKTLMMAGAISATAAGGSILGSALGWDPRLGPAVGAAVGSAAGDLAQALLTSLVGRMGAGWKPIIFGEWLRERIENVVGRTERP